jgi:hypothetical protein
VASPKEITRPVSRPVSAVVSPKKIARPVALSGGAPQFAASMARIAALGIDKPVVLHLYSGQAHRVSAFSTELRAMGLEVDDVDRTSGLADHDILCDVNWARYRHRLCTGYYAGLLTGPPCETASPSRAHAPGPPPLRSHAEFFGLKGLSPALREQVRKANVLWDRALEGCGIMYSLSKPFLLESPLPRSDCASIFQFPKAEQLLALDGVEDVDFDQCMLGGLSVKPTRLRMFLLELPNLHGLRCAHPLCDFSDVDTSRGPVSYRASHRRTVRRKVDGVFATSELAAYPMGLITRLANAFAGAILGPLARDPVTNLPSDST